MAWLMPDHKGECDAVDGMARGEDGFGRGDGENLGRYAASWIACWPKRPSSTVALTWSTRWAPSGDRRVCLRLFMRALTR